MSYYSHQLNSSHSHIIGRIDPITGDSIKENDSVVFCFDCQSCFLEESWNYMNNTHCRQNQTLNFVPLPVPKFIAKKKAQKLIVELKKTMISPFSSIIAIFFFTFMASIFLQLSKINSFVIGLFLGIWTDILIKSKKFKNFVGIKNNEIRIYETYIELEDAKFFWNEIKQIKFVRKMYVTQHKKGEEIYSYPPKLKIELKNGQHIERKLPTKNYHSTKPFLFGLAWVSQFTSIYFDTEHEKEYRLIKSFDRNYQGNIKIEEPRQLTYNPEEN